MGSHDWTLRLIRRAEDGSPYSRGVFYFAKQAIKGVQVVTKIKESLGNWKDAFFFTPEVGFKGRFGSPSKLPMQPFLKTYECAT